MIVVVVISSGFTPASGGFACGLLIGLQKPRVTGGTCRSHSVDTDCLSSFSKGLFESSQVKSTGIIHHSQQGTEKK